MFVHCAKVFVLAASVSPHRLGHAALLRCFHSSLLAEQLKVLLSEPWLLPFELCGLVHPTVL